MDFIVTITDQAQLDGITWAREQYNNAALPPSEDGTYSTPPLATDQDYINWIVTQAASSYAQQKTDAAWRAAYDAAQAEGRAAPPPTGA